MKMERYYERGATFCSSECHRRFVRVGSTTLRIRQLRPSRSRLEMPLLPAHNAVGNQDDRLGSRLCRKLPQEVFYWISNCVFVDLAGCAIWRCKPLAERFRSLATITGAATQTYIYFHNRLVVPSVIIEMLPCRIASSIAVDGTSCELHAAVHALLISGADFSFKLF